MNTVARLALDVGAGAGAVLLTWAVLIVDAERVRPFLEQPGAYLRSALPYAGLLGAVLVVNKFARDVGPEVSWVIGWNITSTVYAIEGDTVAAIQSVATPSLTAAFSFVYLSGYVSILVFPFIAYLPLSDRRPFREMAVAYSVNYLLGLLCYVVFIAYGPRNLIPDRVDALLYATYPQTQILTGEVNANTNVFPSLHTSLSVTVAALAWRTRDVYPRWAVVSTATAATIALSTMYLGIHWATDVAAGVVLGVASVAVAARYVD